MLLPLLLLAARIQPDGVAAPSRQPQLAAAHGIVAMTFGAGSTIYFTSSSDQGRTFLPPSKVAEAGALALGRHRGPRVAVLKDLMVISAIVADKKAIGPHAHGLPESGNLTVWRSVDRGKTWKQSGVINDVPGAAREGLHAMAAGPDGSLFAIWLDLRMKGTQLYGARSTNGGVTWSKNIPVYSSPDGTICQCCHPTLTIDERGQVWAMWRNVVAGSRDLYITKSQDGIRFDAARKLGQGTWKINACPMDGGGFFVHNDKVISAWRRESDVFLSDGDNSERQVGTGKDIAIVQGKHGTYIAWSKDGAIQIVTPQSTKPSVLASEGAFPTLIALPDGSVVAAWESHNSIESKQVN